MGMCVVFSITFLWLLTSLEDMHGVVGLVEEGVPVSYIAEILDPMHDIDLNLDSLLVYILLLLQGTLALLREMAGDGGRGRSPLPLLFAILLELVVFLER